MDLETFVEIINVLGFPVVACGALFWMNREQAKYYRSLLSEFRETIHNNTNAINHLIQKIDKR